MIYRLYLLPSMLIVMHLFLFFLDRWGYEQFNDGTSQSLDTGEYKVKCTGLKYCQLRYYFLHAFSISLCGIPYLFLSWYPQFKAKLGYAKCDLKDADAVLIKVLYMKIKFVDIL